MDKTQRFEEPEIENGKNSLILSHLINCGIINREGHFILQKKRDEKSKMD